MHTRVQTEKRIRMSKVSRCCCHYHWHCHLPISLYICFNTDFLYTLAWYSPHSQPTQSLCFVCTFIHSIHPISMPQFSICCHLDLNEWCFFSRSLVCFDNKLCKYFDKIPSSTTDKMRSNVKRVCMCEDCECYVYYQISRLIAAPNITLIITYDERWTWLKFISMSD